MKHKITNEFDYLVARAEFETESARKVLAEVRTAGDYWGEKSAAKLVALCESQERLSRLYAEAKLYFPETAETIERRWPHLKELEKEMKKEYEEFQGGAH